MACIVIKNPRLAGVKQFPVRDGKMSDITPETIVANAALR